MNILAALKESHTAIRNAKRVSVVETALLANGYASFILELHPYIEAHVARHPNAEVEVIIESFTEWIERIKKNVAA